MQQSFHTSENPFVSKMNWTLLQHLKWELSGLFVCSFDINWHIIDGKNDGANAKRERYRRLYDKQITMGQGIFHGLPDVYIALYNCQP